MLTTYEGGTAISPFRARALLTRLRTVAPQIGGVSARFVHWVWTDDAPSPQTLDTLRRLLTYGEPYAGPAPDAPGAVLVVAPRLGTVSPWASKATDIAHSCGLDIRRVERVTEYHLVGADLSSASWAACGDLLHDRMTESVLPSRAADAGASS